MKKQRIILSLLSFLVISASLDAGATAKRATPVDAPMPPAAGLPVPQAETNRATVSDGFASQLDHPNTISFELLGRAALYSINYDRMVNENVAIGAGISYWTLSVTTYSSSASRKFFVMPLYGNYYFSPAPNRGFLTAGLDVVFASAQTAGSSSNIRIAGSGAFATFGGGYEYRNPEGGFLFRAAPYFLVGSDVDLWFGLTFGGTY